MARILRGGAWPALWCAVALGFAACGGESNGGAEDEGDGERGGGAIKGAMTSFPDFLDPALAYTQEAWQTLWTVYTPLLTYPHMGGVEGAEVVPGLAESLPDVSDDGRTYRLRLRRGLRYSDGTPVRASDFEHAIKRVLNLESGAAPFYEGIVGAERYVREGRARADIAGIETDDRTGEITIRLTDADGRFPNILAMTFAAPVPGDTPFENRTASPPPGVGPYRLADVRGNRGYELVRVPGFRLEGVPPAMLDRISMQVVKSRRRQTEQVIAGELDYMVDPPAPDQLRDVRARFTGDRYREYVTNSTYYFFLNHRVPPFDSLEARQAVNYAVDKRALARLFGGLLEPGCNFLPPGMIGYREIDPCPYGDPAAEPDLGKARALVERAGAKGRRVSVFGSDGPESRAATEYLADVLDRIGFEARPRIVEGSVYVATIGNQRTRAQTGFANWFQDFPHPGNFTFLVDGDSIQQTNNANLGNVDDDEIDALLDRANPNPDIRAVADEYAQVDRLLLERAHLVPYGHRKLAAFTSERIDFAGCVVWHPLYTVDFTKLCLKEAPGAT